jgi:hypothetical protein
VKKKTGKNEKLGKFFLTGLIFLQCVADLKLTMREHVMCMIQAAVAPSRGHSCASSHFAALGGCVCGGGL